MRELIYQYSWHDNIIIMIAWTVLAIICGYVLLVDSTNKILGKSYRSSILGLSLMFFIFFLMSLSYIVGNKKTISAVMNDELDVDIGIVNDCLERRWSDSTVILVVNGKRYRLEKPMPSLDKVCHMFLGNIITLTYIPDYFEAGFVIKVELGPVHQ